MMSDEEIVKAALEEDIPHGDITTDPLLLQGQRGFACLVAKQDLVLSGAKLFLKTFLLLDAQARLEWRYRDGDVVMAGAKIVEIEGDKGALLKAERTALNFLGHLSGIATLTKQYVDQVRGTQTKILDTRKTTPLLRRFEKQAVKDGGGINHRFSLSDGILIKENHIRAAGGIAAAVKRIMSMNPGKSIEIEVTNSEEVAQALELGVDHLLLDNMSLEEMANALKLVGKKAKTEASGNMTLDRIRQVAQIGVDYISVGRITHSAPCVDVSLLFD